MYISNIYIPTEVLNKFCSYLDFNDLCSFRLVTKIWLSVSQNFFIGQKEKLNEFNKKIYNEIKEFSFKKFNIKTSKKNIYLLDDKIHISINHQLLPVKFDKKTASPKSTDYNPPYPYAAKSRDDILNWEKSYEMQRREGFCDLPNLIFNGELFCQKKEEDNLGLYRWNSKCMSFEKKQTIFLCSGLKDLKKIGNTYFLLALNGSVIFYNDDWTSKVFLTTHQKSIDVFSRKLVTIDNVGCVSFFKKNGAFSFEKQNSFKIRPANANSILVSKIFWSFLITAFDDGTVNITDLFSQKKLADYSICNTGNIFTNKTTVALCDDENTVFWDFN